MSESILDHGYVPEEHAPDPVMGHGDPTPPGKVAIWLFLASEIMFFIAILATYIIFRSGSPKFFAEQALILSKPLAGLNTLVLISSSLTMALAVDAAQKNNRSRLMALLGLTIVFAFGFMVIKYIEYKAKFTHHTIVASEVIDPKTKKAVAYVYDGHLVEKSDKEYKLEGYRARIDAPKAGEPSLNIHWMTEEGVARLAAMQASQAGANPTTAASAEAKPAAAEAKAETKAAAHDVRPGGAQEWTIDKTRISQDITYGPWKNIFFASYFTLTGIHGLHVLGGIVALGLLFAQSLRGKIFPAQTEYVGLYWHFVDLVWIFLFPLLYLI